MTPTISAVSGNNTAIVSGGGDPTCPATRAARHRAGAGQRPQLTMTKTASAAPFVVGTPASYTLTVTEHRHGGDDGGRTITDTIPPG